MKILYDHQMFSIQKYGGVTKYFCELMKHIPAEHQFELGVIFSDNHYLKEDHTIFKKWNIPIADKQFKGKGPFKKAMYSINQYYSRHVISSKKFDLIHPTYYNTCFLNKAKKPYVITVHDLIPFKIDAYIESSLRDNMARAINNATRIISVSENTKKDLIEILKISPDKIDTIYHGFNMPIIQNQPNIYGRYILFVGRRSGYKNFKIFIEAISVLLNKQADLKLICIGEPFNKKEIILLKTLKIKNQIIALTVSENSLNKLYRHAEVFVYPSLYEGFGMPILEAFSNNCPICLSNTGSLPEIAGNAGFYFDPYCKESILNAVKKMINDKGLSNELVNLGKARLKEFSWTKTACQTINIYEKALGA